MLSSPPAPLSLLLYSSFFAAVCSDIAALISHFIRFDQLGCDLYSLLNSILFLCVAVLRVRLFKRTSLYKDFEGTS
ncbi:hypothetical protein DITRI_Ditri05aG0045200 [Diplodiscus trichospermus]